LVYIQTNKLFKLFKIVSKNEYKNLLKKFTEEIIFYSDEYEKCLKIACGKIENISLTKTFSLLNEKQIITPNENFLNGDGSDSDDKCADKYFRKNDLNIAGFLKPKIGSKDWMQEQSEIIYNLIYEKKIIEAAYLIKQIKSFFNFKKIKYEVKVEIDKVFNYFLDQLNFMLIVIII